VLLRQRKLLAVWMCCVSAMAKAAGLRGPFLRVAFIGGLCLCSGLPVKHGGRADEAEAEHGGLTTGAATPVAQGCRPWSQDHMLLTLSHQLMRPQSATEEKARLPRSDATSPGGSRGAADASLLQTLAAVQTLTNHVLDGTKQVDESTMAVLEDIRHEMEQVLNSTLMDHRQSQDLVDRTYYNISSCDEHVAFVVDAAAKGKLHDSCRSSEAQLKRRRSEACEHHAEVLFNPKVPECVSKLQQVGGGDYHTTRLCFESISAWIGPSNASLTTSKVDCDAASVAHDDQVGHCNMKQAAFETNFCDRYEGVADSCSQYRKCRVARLAEQERVHAEVNVTEHGRKATAVAATKSQCYLTALGAEHEQRRALLGNCSSVQPSISHLDIVYHLAPEGKTCNESAAIPCDRDWLVEHYERKPWYADAPVASCTPCETEVVAFIPSGASPSAGGGSA